MIYKGTTKEIKHVFQKENYDCAVACLAMMTGEDYEIIFSMLTRLGWRPDLEMGVTDRQICLLLREFGERPVMSFHLHPIPSIVTVPSINQRAKFHAVFYDGEETVYDPMWKKPFKNFYEKDYDIGYVCAKSITLEKYFESELSWDNGHTVPWGGFETPRDKEMEGLGKRLVKNMVHWDEREQPINQHFKWQIEEMEKVLLSRGIDVRNECK